MIILKISTLSKIILKSPNRSCRSLQKEQQPQQKQLFTIGQNVLTFTPEALGVEGIDFLLNNYAKNAFEKCLRCFMIDVVTIQSSREQ